MLALVPTVISANAGWPSGAINNRMAKQPDAIHFAKRETDTDISLPQLARGKGLSETNGAGADMKRSPGNSADSIESWLAIKLPTQASPLPAGARRMHYYNRKAPENAKENANYLQRGGRGDFGASPPIARQNRQ